MNEKDKEKKTETTAEGTEENKDNDEDVTVTQKKIKKTFQININRDKEIEALQKELAEEKAKSEREREEREEEKQKEADEKTKIQEELAEKQSILEKQALEAFEKEKKELLELAKSSNLSDDQMAEIEERLTTPEKLEMVKALVTMLAPKPAEGKDGTKPPEEKKPPTGKATITPPTRKGDSKVYDSPEALISDLYWKAYYARDNQITVQERREALDKINKLWAALIGGKGWKQLKEGTNRLPTDYRVSQCPHCHQVILGTPAKCPYCGHDLQEKERMKDESGKW